MTTAFIKGLGLDYFQHTYMNTFFDLDGKVHKIVNTAGREAMECRVYLRDGDSSRTIVPLSVFTGFSMFRIPRLGYRVDGDNNLVWLDSTRSTTRGMRMDRLAVSRVPCVRDLLAQYGGLRMKITDEPVNVYYPQFPKFTDVLPQLLTGERVNAALSHDAAVVLDAHRRGVPISILYRQRRVGEVSEDGTVLYNGVAIKQAMLNKLLRKED